VASYHLAPAVVAAFELEWFAVAQAFCWPSSLVEFEASSAVAAVAWKWFARVQYVLFGVAFVALKWWVAYLDLTFDY
jgi:hypothetical protein